MRILMRNAARAYVPLDLLRCALLQRMDSNKSLPSR